MCVTACTVSAVSNLLSAQGRSALHHQTPAAKMQSCCCKKKNQVQKFIICSYLQRRMERRTRLKFLIHRILRLRKHPLRWISTPSTHYMANRRRMSTILVTSASIVSRWGEKHSYVHAGIPPTMTNRCRDTPDNDQQFGNVAKQNYPRLTEKQREWLRSLGRAPRWLVVSSGSCPPSFVHDPQKIPANVSNKPEHASDKMVSFTRA